MNPHVQHPPVRRLRAALVVGAVALALGASAVPAGAADDDPAGPVEVTGYSSSQCAAGRFCLWSGTGFSGAFWSTGATGLQATTLGSAGSVWNRMALDVRTYSGSGGTGSTTCWNAGAQTPSTSVGSLSVRTMTATTC
ncbi:peptidase inhibitor family I36 protein [Cellulomonas pakistanensis]|nr:peptidase inhibitor family I36 protein [Cellulomonas pakistanensis]